MDPTLETDSVHCQRIRAAGYWPVVIPGWHQPAVSHVTHTSFPSLSHKLHVHWLRRGTKNYRGIPKKKKKKNRGRGTPWENILGDGGTHGKKLGGGLRKFFKGGYPLKKLRRGTLNFVRGGTPKNFLGGWGYPLGKNIFRGMEVPPPPPKKITMGDSLEKNVFRGMGVWFTVWGGRGGRQKPWSPFPIPCPVPSCKSLSKTDTSI